MIWNREMRALAEEELADAAGLVGPLTSVDYQVAVGGPADALSQASVRSGADVVVLAWEPTGRLRRLFSPAVVEDLREAGGWEVIVAPAETPRSRDDTSLGVRAGVVGSGHA